MVLHIFMRMIHESAHTHIGWCEVKSKSPSKQHQLGWGTLRMPYLGHRRHPQEHNETRYSINDARPRRGEILRRQLTAACAASAACAFAAIAESVAGVAAPPAAFSLH